MQLRVLGCSGSIASGSHTSTFLLDDDILIDAGTGVGGLTVDEMARIDHIFITHSHLDHVVSIGFLADTVMRLRQRASRPPVRVHALPETLDALRRHVFNGVIWPDFSALPSPRQPTLAFEPLQTGDIIALGDRRIEALPAEHSVPAVGYAVSPADEPGRVWAYTGDTGPCPALWQRLNELDVAALIAETAFSDDDALLARISGHHCPATLLAGLGELRQPTTVHLTHIKPGEHAAVLRSLGLACQQMGQHNSPQAGLRSSEAPLFAPCQGGHHRLQPLQQGQQLNWERPAIFALPEQALRCAV
ncbi:MBL fold metallo-hydrolase [Amphibiibacter pelophylacis]|uniref:3',5'-cyclic-nucleotide phosphodiesterase n=1 Tax=Amphibiibacter pelophylacis TaxID=1799477 RepID=A0ACC6NY08_9BURK